MLWVYELKGSRPPEHLPESEHAGMWPEPPFYYLFYKRDVIEAIRGWVQANPEWEIHAQYCVPYERWQDVSVPRIDIGPFAVELVGVPSAGEARPVSGSPASLLWAEDEEGSAGPEVEKIPLRIDPGIVFGSGLHPTTQGCLLAISELFGPNRHYGGHGLDPGRNPASFEIKSALDFGTGTGVLAIACALMGAKSVLAIDRVPLALQVASKNAGLNGVCDRIGFLAADRLEVADIRPDLLLMNLEWSIQEKVLLDETWRRAGVVVLAGFLQSRAEGIAQLARPGFKVVRSFSHEGWPTIILTREQPWV